MEYHFTESTDTFGGEFSGSFAMASGEAEYQVRHTLLVDGGSRFGVSALVFDKYEELVWMGNEGGHVTSYYGPSLQKYTSFQIHANEEVRDILTLEQGIYCLTKSTLRHQIRRGIPKHTHKSTNMVDMQCLLQTGTTNVLMGGHQDILLSYDLAKIMEVVIPIESGGCVILRSGGGSLVACGSASGVVSLRDTRSPRSTVQHFKAHSACLSDVDMQGDLLITAGFTDSTTGVAMAEPYVLVWDVRRLRSNTQAEYVWKAPMASPPLLLHFLPTVSGRAAAVSGDGHVALLNLANKDEEKTSTFQVDTQNSVCRVMDVSSTSQAFAFGDQSGHLHLFSPQHNTEPVFNNFSRDTEFANSPTLPPFANFKDKTFKYSSVPLPSLTSGNRWFNALPPDFFKRHYRKPKPIDPEVLKTMKMQGPIGYAPNPKTTKRNQYPYVPDNLEDISARQNEAKANSQPIPKQYLKVLIVFTLYQQIAKIYIFVLISRLATILRYYSGYFSSPFK